MDKPDVFVSLFLFLIVAITSYLTIRYDQQKLLCLDKDIRVYKCPGEHWLVLPYKYLRHRNANTETNTHTNVPVTIDLSYPSDIYGIKTQIIVKLQSQIQIQMSSRSLTGPTWQIYTALLRRIIGLSFLDRSFILRCAFVLWTNAYDHVDLLLSVSYWSQPFETQYIFFFYMV